MKCLDTSVRETLVQETGEPHPQIQRDRTRRALLKFQFALLFGPVWQFSTKQAQYNEGCSISMK